MRFSPLQKFILLTTYNARGYRIKRDSFLVYFQEGKSKAKAEIQAKILTGSLENLIDKGLMIGFGRRTPKKWFLEEVKLTEVGIKQTRKLIGEQMELPIKNG